MNKFSCHKAGKAFVHFCPDPWQWAMFDDPWMELFYLVMYMFNVADMGCWCSFSRQSETDFSQWALVIITIWFVYFRSRLPKY